MKIITKYQAVDGSEWPSETKATQRDSLCSKVTAVMEPLGETHPGVKAGKGWFQHDPEVVLTARDGVLDICREEKLHEDYPVFMYPGRLCHPFSAVGRILSDIGGPLDQAWYRFMCIDEQGREHPQPYFVLTGAASLHVCVGAKVQ